MALAQAALLAAALLAPATGCSKARTALTQDVLPTAQATRGPMRVTIKATGSIQAANSKKIIPALKRNGMIEFLIQEGVRVKEGELLARINTEDLDRLVKDVEIKVSEQEVRLESAKTDLEIQDMENAVQLRQAEQELQNAAQELAKFLSGDRPLETRNATVKTETTRRQLGRRERRVTEIATLLKDGFVTEDQVEEERIAVEEARMAAETAVAELNLQTNFALPLREARLRSALDKTQTELDKKRKSTVAQRRQKEQAVSASGQLLEKHQMELKALKDELAACTVKAPTDGLVLYGDPQQPWRRSEVQVGGRVYPGQTMLTIPDLGVMKAVVNISESDANRVATQQTAVITVEAAAGQTFTGTVVKASEVANSQGWWREGDVKEYAADLSLPAGNNLKPELSCTAEIMVETLADTLSVPVQSVFKRENNFMVYVVRDGAATEKVIKTGKSSDTRVQVLEGISEGDEVALIRPPDARTQ
jgi:HlyD family secretion protein